MQAIVLDWDDTLFSTSYLEKKGINLNNKSHYQHRFKLLENSIIQLLEKVLEYDQVYIMTNASMSWFNECLDNYCPQIKSYLKNLKGIISARDMYGDYIPDFKMWKCLCVLDIIAINKITSILFVSDMNHDFEAVHKTKVIYPNLKIKTYKFMEKPMICQLIKQQINFTKFLDYIINNDIIINYKFSFE